MAAWSMLASCNSPEDAFECQRRLAGKATAGYVAEVAKLSQMMMSLASEELEPRQRDTHAGAQGVSDASVRNRMSQRR